MVGAGELGSLTTRTPWGRHQDQHHSRDQHPPTVTQTRAVTQVTTRSVIGVR